MAALHIGLIPDGTRRWARINSVALTDAYFQMVSVIATSIDTLFEYGAQNVSVYLLSKENLKREPSELKAVLDAEIYFLQKLIPNLATKHSFGTKLAGNINLLPEWAKTSVLSTPLSSSPISKNLYLCMAYSPFDEILECLEKNGNQLNDSNLIKNLWVPVPLDIVIRTSGEKRLSSFLPLQTTYSELFFVPEFINDLTKKILLDCLENYQSRNRRLGK